MDKEELEKKIKAALPDKWEFSRMYETTNDRYDWSFMVTCPISDRMGDPEKYRAKVDKICIATGSIHDGGGWAIGGNLYDNFFYHVKQTKNEKE